MSAASGAERDTALPAAYLLFLPVLDQLSVPLRQLVRGQLAQFERLIDSFDEVELRENGDFEGLGSLATRGDIAHIVQSELLLRTEAPLEFLRRLAESETLYHQKEYSDPGAKPVYRLTISVGPGLLGHGRVLALAAIFFLARVATLRGAAFHWCFVPRADGAVWFDVLSINTIKRFLRAASYREANLEEVAEAHVLWESLVPAVPDRTDVKRIDWIIGAADRLPPELSARAVSHAPRALSFALRSPTAGTSRAADVVVRRRGRVVRRAVLDFPADTICLSALNMPFAPVKPSPGTAVVRLAEPVGWEPRYLVMPHGGARILRVPDGLLILISNKRFEIGQGFFVRLTSQVRLAGIRLRTNNQLTILLQTEVSGKERFVLTVINLAAGMAPVGKASVRVQDAVSSHLFRGQHPYAIPLLFDGYGVEFYSTHRHKFGLQFTEKSRTMEFQVLHQRPPILHANGVHHVLRMEEKGAAFHNVLRNNNSLVARYKEHDPVVPQRLFGMIYSGSHSSLAYSAEPNVWSVAGPSINRSFNVASHETPLLAKVKDEAVVATIWSDVRAGGNGTLRTVTLSDGETKSHNTLLRMGDDAGRIAEVRITHEGILAVTLDEAGAPAQLLDYHRKGRDGPHQCTRFELADLVAQAIDIDPHGHMHG